MRLQALIALLAGSAVAFGCCSVWSFLLPEHVNSITGLFYQSFSNGSLEGLIVSAGSMVSFAWLLTATKPPAESPTDTHKELPVMVKGSVLLNGTFLIDESQIPELIEALLIRARHLVQPVQPERPQPEARTANETTREAQTNESQANKPNGTEEQSEEEPEKVPEKVPLLRGDICFCL